MKVLMAVAMAHGGACVGYGFFGDHALPVWGGFFIGLGLFAVDNLFQKGTKDGCGSGEIL
jgi:hypothetical protein